MVPGTTYPIYGYAASRTARTIGKLTSSIHLRYSKHILVCLTIFSCFLLAGLVKPDAARNDRYIRNIETYLLLTDSFYEWTVEDDIDPGTYRLGIGFYFHEDSPIFHIE